MTIQAIAASAAGLATTRVDAAALGVYAAVDIALLVGLLVVASVLQLSRNRQGDRFSLEAAEAWGHSTTILRLVQTLILLSTLGGTLSLVGTTTSVIPVGAAALVLTILSVLVFAWICILSIRWFWTKPVGADGEAP